MNNKEKLWFGLSLAMIPTGTLVIFFALPWIVSALSLNTHKADAWMCEHTVKENHWFCD